MFKNLQNLTKFTTQYFKNLSNNSSNNALTLLTKSLFKNSLQNFSTTIRPKYNKGPIIEHDIVYGSTSNHPTTLKKRSIEQEIPNNTPKHDTIIPILQDIITEEIINNNFNPEALHKKIADQLYQITKTPCQCYTKIKTENNHIQITITWFSYDEDTNLKKNQNITLSLPLPKTQETKLNKELKLPVLPKSWECTKTNIITNHNITKLLNAAISAYQSYTQKQLIDDKTYSNAIISAQKIVAKSLIFFNYHFNPNDIKFEFFPNIATVKIYTNEIKRFTLTPHFDEKNPTKITKVIVQSPFDEPFEGSTYTPTY